MPPRARSPPRLRSRRTPMQTEHRHDPVRRSRLRRSGPLWRPHTDTNIDRMAAEGMRFTDFYAAYPVCSPSRAALLTGKYPTRVGVPRVLFPDDKGGLDLAERTMADHLKSDGYRTFIVGKWHLGCTPPYLPQRRGFDHWFGIPYSNDMRPRKLMRDDQVLEQEANLNNLTEPTRRNR